MDIGNLETRCPKCGNISQPSFLFDNKCVTCINKLIDDININRPDPTICVSYDLYKHLCKLAKERKLNDQEI